MRRPMLLVGLLLAALTACSSGGAPEAGAPSTTAAPATRSTSTSTTSTTAAPCPPAPPAACNVTTADPEADAATRSLLALFERMEGRSSKRVMIGTHVNVHTFRSEGREKVAEADALVGDGRHVALRTYGTGPEAPPAAYLRDMIRHHRAGGVVLVDFSPPNPVNDLSPSSRSRQADMVSMAAITTPGDAVHAAYLGSVDELCRNYLLPLQEAGVEVIVRPLYEANNSGWWYAQNPEGVGNRGADGSYAGSDWTYERFVTLYRQTWDHITGTCGAHNVLSAWTMHFGWPLEGEGGRGSMLQMYPGPEYVDIIGGSWYEVAPDDDEIQRIRDLREAIPGHPIGAMETGRSQETGAGPVDLTLWREVLADLPITSMMFWNNAHDIGDQENGAELLRWDGNMTREDVRAELDRG